MTYKKKIEYELSEAQTSLYLSERTRLEKQQLEKQKAEMSEEDYDSLTQGGKYPYSGAIGGCESWTLTGTSIGTVVTVEMYGETVDLSDYGSW